MPTWDEFAWAAFLYWARTDRDHYYQCLMKKGQVLSDLRTSPGTLQPADIQSHLLKGFLNPWGCQVPNNQQSAQALRDAIQGLVPYLQALNALGIETVNFTEVLKVSNIRKTIAQAIEDSYGKLGTIGYNFGPVAASKVLHILQPRLFVMWDNKIMAHYSRENSQVADSGQGYCVYLQIIQHVATQVCAGFRNATLNPAAGANQAPADYLSVQMNYNPSKTLAKYLDEYNWVTITTGLKVPPVWHP